MAEFDPRQLDALEDALEELDRPHDLNGPHGRVPDLNGRAELDLAPELLARLAEYQQVLALTRDAFPLEEPPAGLLDHVLAEAREATRKSTVAATPRAASWRGAWGQWRNTLVPVATLAGAAALVLWIAQPGDDQQLANVEREQAADHRATADEGEAARSRGVDEARGEPVEAVEADAAQSTTDPAAESPSQPAELEQPAKSSPTRKQASPGAGATAPAVAPEPLSKDETWKSLERANTARRKGDCDRARTLYDEVIAAGVGSTATAQAKAGIGLCFEQDRHSSEAEQWFDLAREHNPGIDSWIRSQRDDQPLPGEKKKSKMNDSFEADAL